MAEEATSSSLLNLNAFLLLHCSILSISSSRSPISSLSALGLAESLFSAHKDDYLEHEQASLRQLYKSKMEELQAEDQHQVDITGAGSCSKAASNASNHQHISVTLVTEFVRWNEEAISTWTSVSSQTAALATNVKSVFTCITCLLDQVRQYLTEGLERARESLTEAAALRDRYMIGTSVSRRVAAAAASAAEAAAAAGESSFRCFMIAVQRSAISVAILRTSQMLLPGSYFPWMVLTCSCEEMGTAVSSVETAAHKGLLQCIDTVTAEDLDNCTKTLQSSRKKSGQYHATSPSSREGSPYETHTAGASK